VHVLPGPCVLVNAQGGVEAANGPALKVLGLDMASVDDGVTLDQDWVRPMADAATSFWHAVREGKEVVANARVGQKAVAATIRSTPVQVIGGEPSSLWCIETIDAGNVPAMPDFLSAILEKTPECVKVVAEDGSLLQMNSAGLQMIEAPSMDAVRGASVPELVCAQDREEWRRAHERVCAGESLVWEFCIVGLEGTHRHMESHAAPILLPDGSRAHVAVTRDITQRVEAERQKTLLIAELNHRVKNSLTTVQAMAFHTFVNPDSMSDLAKFEDRIMALSAAHNVLNRSSWSVAALDEVVRESCTTLQISADRITVEGPSIEVRPQAALALTMYLHELLTNALKYGALSSPAGRVHISWELDAAGAGEFVLRWSEVGGPPVREPERVGFGSELITEGIPRQLKGRSVLHYGEDGVRCTLTVPRNSLDAGAYAEVSS
jgi:PAS domain S-box-containing protein